MLLTGALLGSAALGLAGNSLSSGLNFASSKYATDKNVEMNRENNQFNAEQAQIQRDWETEMSNSAIQRKKADLEAAGFNPLLAVGPNMAGATTPTSAAASSSGFAGAHSARFDLASGLPGLVNSAFAVKQLNELTNGNSQAIRELARINYSAAMHSTSANQVSDLVRLSRIMYK